jgi:hypothetical protein
MLQRSTDRHDQGMEAFAVRTRTTRTLRFLPVVHARRCEQA